MCPCACVYGCVRLSVREHEYVHGCLCGCACMHMCRVVCVCVCVCVHIQCMHINSTRSELASLALSLYLWRCLSGMDDIIIMHCTCTVLYQGPWLYCIVLVVTFNSCSYSLLSRPFQADF